MHAPHSPGSLTPAELAAAETLITLALAEDLDEAGDLTANATIPTEALGSAMIATRADGVIAGLGVVALLAARMDLADGWRPLVADGARIEAGRALARVSGRMRALLGFERTALNILQHMSGVATLTARFVRAVEGTHAVILDTRKTLPGWRLLDKYAVRRGGGRNHRLGLFDAVLIKDNHLAWLAHEGDPIGVAVRAARAAVPPGTTIEVEVDTLDQFERALACRPDAILLDNFDPERLRQAVDRRDRTAPAIKLEASGGVSLDTVRAVAAAGIDFISVGALTHSAPGLDLGLDFETVIPSRKT